MLRRLKEIHSSLAYVVSHLEEDVSLATLAGKARTSTFHFHRLFSAAVGESPKRLSLRLRLDRAAAMLLAADDPVIAIALSCGFDSHEVFTRAFQRRFGITPSRYRQRGFAGSVDSFQASKHAEIISSVGPCIGLYHFSENGRLADNEMPYTITKTELAPQPVLVGRRRVKRSEIAATIGGVLAHVFQFAQQHAIALTGLPFTRYVEVGAGLITMEPGMRIAATPDQTAIRIDPSWTVASGEAAVQVDTLPGGPAAVTTHVGPYDMLPDAYGALEAWIEAERLVKAGPPWESYLTDPSEFPDPKDWKTEICWPLKRS